MRHANVPPAFVVVQRINLGLFAVLAALGATANWRRLAEEMWPWVDGPPSTPLGELEHALAGGTGRRLIARTVGLRAMGPRSPGL